MCDFIVFVLGFHDLIELANPDQCPLSTNNGLPADYHFNKHRKHSNTANATMELDATRAKAMILPHGVTKTTSKQANNNLQSYLPFSISK